MTNQENLKKESVDRCKKLIDEVSLRNGCEIVLGFLEDPKQMDELIKTLIAFTLFLKMSKRMEEYTVMLQAATVLSIEQTLFNQFQREMKDLSPNN